MSKEDTLIFNGIRRLLDRQFQRLSPLEKSLMYWLAINREWTSIGELQTDIIPAVAKIKLLEALEALSFRCLIERQGTLFTQQPVVMEYIIEQILDLALRDLEESTLDFLFTHALLKATAKDYVRESQRRAIIQPLCDRLLERFEHQTSLIQHLQQQLYQLHPATPSSYGAGNIINLLFDTPPAFRHGILGSATFLAFTGVETNRSRGNISPSVTSRMPSGSCTT
jgi:hypothetical protein